MLLQGRDFEGSQDVTLINILKEENFSFNACSV